MSVKLADFGLAKIIGEASFTTTLYVFILHRRVTTLIEGLDVVPQVVSEYHTIHTCESNSQ